MTESLFARAHRALNRVRGTLLVAATYVYFLLFAQYGLVRLLDERFAGESEPVQLAMAAMGLSGICASFVVGSLLRVAPGESLLRIGFAACAVVAVAASGATRLSSLVVLSGCVGVALATVTVTLAARLRTWASGSALGLQIGLGTGAAYLLCNLPPLFEGAPQRQAVLAAAAAVVGMLVASGRPHAPVGAPAGSADRDARPLRFAGLVLVLLALVWLDSAAFNVIQLTGDLKAVTWEGGGKIVLGVTHFCAAVLAGLALDRGALRSLLLATFALFVVAFRLLVDPAGAPIWAGPLYAVGISVYSTVLVALPSLHGIGAGLVPRRLRAAALFGIAGWLGSALGVGMAQDLRTIPAWFLWAAGVVVVASVALGWAPVVRVTQSAAGLRSLATALVIGCSVSVASALVGGLDHGPFGLGSAALSDPEGARIAADRDAAARGRAVYVREGCINCHSQYVRPATFDEQWWGPARPLDRSERPLLVGNRRQGPDLLNAGNRRSADWHRQHLVDPRSVSPGSRMPSYAHLFADSRATAGSAGEDLVAYLESLGRESATARTQWAQTAPVDVRGGDVLEGRELFATYCAVCHGTEARGDGPVAELVDGRAIDLRKEVFWLPTWGDEGTLEEGLARLVRYGMAGSSMPGHEWLSDAQLADLTAFLVTLPGTSQEAAK